MARAYFQQILSKQTHTHTLSFVLYIICTLLFSLVSQCPLFVVVVVEQYLLADQIYLYIYAYRECFLLWSS